jgi:hypothetical protein
VNCWDISGVEGVSQCYFYCGFQLLGVKVACGSVSELHKKALPEIIFCDIHVIISSG